MTNIAANINARVTADGTWIGVKRFRGTKHLASRGNCVVTFPYHGADWARNHVVDETFEERFG